MCVPGQTTSSSYQKTFNIYRSRKKFCIFFYYVMSNVLFWIDPFLPSWPGFMFLA